MAQVGDLVVTGSSRFLNKINGVCTDGTSGTTKYMRQDGTWQVPPNDNTTYTLDVNGNNIRLKNQGGTVISTVTAPYATDSGKLNGYASDTSATNNTIARRTANGYIFATYFNQSSGAETPTSSSYIIYANSDGYFRKSTVANMKTAMSLNNVENKSSTTIRGEITSANVTTALGYTPANKAGDTFTGRVVYKNVSMPLSAGKVTSLTAGTTEIFKDGIAISNPATANDVGWIRVTGTGEADTVLEIATGDDGGMANAETIAVRQYNTSNNIAKEAILLNPSGNTSFPGSVTGTGGFIGNLTGNADTATSATKATQDSDGKAINTTYLKLSGGTMTGQIQTSFKNAVATGSRQSDATTITDLIADVRYSSGCCGSVSIGTAYKLNDVTIPTGWYNYTWIPHRSGGKNGSADGDNCNYGVLYLSHMTSPSNGTYEVSFSGSTIAQVRMIASFTTAPTTGQVLISDGVYGGIKSSGYTIAKSVPSNAVFTDTNYYHTTGSWSGLTYTATANGGAGALAFTIPTGTSATTVALGNHTHNYAGSSSAGGDATRALKLKDKTNNNDTYLDYGSSAVTWGNITYLGAWDGYTLRAMNKNQITPANIGAAAASHNQSADTITNGYLNIQPENSPIIIPFMHNDLAYMITRGGSVVVKYDGTVQSIDMSGCFDAGPGYGYGISNSSSYTTIIMELTLHQTFTWTNTIYVDFGSSGWRAKDVEIEVINTNYANDVWTNKYHNTANGSGHCYVVTSHTPVGASNAGGGFNKIRFTFKSFNNNIFRIAQLGLYNYGSGGVRTTYMSRGIDDAIWRSITPATNNTYNLGSSSYKWKNVYATTFTGALTGNVTGNCSGSSGSCTGNAATATTAGNVTGTVAIANGGTGATTRLNALKALTSEDVGTSAQYFLTITQSWGKGGYTSVADAKTVLGLGSAAYTASTAYLASTTKYAASASVGGAASSLANFENNNSTGKNANDVTYNAHTYYTSNGPATSLGASTTDGALYCQAYSTSWIAQIAQDYRNGNLFTRGKNNGTWKSWRKVFYADDTYSGSLTKSQVTTALGYTPPTSDTNTTYTFATGSTNGAFSVTPSGGSAQSVSIKGLGSAAYTASTAYLASSTKYAGSSSAGGAATSANKLNTNAGSATNPVYFSGGVPVACSYNLSTSSVSGEVASGSNTTITRASLYALVFWGSGSDATIAYTGPANYLTYARNTNTLTITLSSATSMKLTNLKNATQKYYVIFFG